MKTKYLLRVGRGLAFVSLSGLVVAGVSSASESAPKDYVLFVGADLSVNIDGKAFPVIGAGNRTVIIDTKPTPKEMPLARAKDMRIRRGLKLTNATAVITKVTAELSSDQARAEQHEAEQNEMAMHTIAERSRDKLQGEMVEATYGFGIIIDNPNDPMLQKKANADDLMRRYVAEQPKIDRQISVAQDLVLKGAPVNDGTGIQLTPEIIGSKVRLQADGVQPTRPTAASAGNAGATGGAPTIAGAASEASMPHVRDAGDGRSDRFDLEFTLTTPRPMDDAYVVLITEYSPPAESSTVFRRVLTQRVSHIDASPRKIHLYQTSFPPGFHLRTYMLGVYADGREIATNLSENRLDLSGDDAYEYLVADYLASHKGQTLPPAAVLMASRTELRRSVGADALQQPVYVAVNDQGEVISISTDAYRVSLPPASVGAALKHFRFIPAIEKGVPVAGRAKLVVADFTR